MKINELLVEGFWSGLGKGIGAVAKGVGQGLANTVAPGAYDSLSKSFKQAKSAKTPTQQGLSKPGNIRYKGNEYQWLGQQWGLVNPETGKTVPAPKQVQQQLNFMSTRKVPSKQDVATAKTQMAKQSASQQGPMLDQIKFMNHSPLVYQFGGKANLFTLNDNDQWTKYFPGSTKVQPPVDVNTSQLLDKAAQRDNIDIARLQPQTPNTSNDVVTQTDATKVASVTTPKGIRADKWSDGHWTTPDDTGKDGFVVDTDVPHLEQLLAQQRK